MSGGHSGEEIPVPIPNTEVKLSNADDTASRGGKVGSRRAFFLPFTLFGAVLKMKNNVFFKGLRDGFPIGLGYFAVAFSLGIVAKNAGLNFVEGFFASFLDVASAGEYALFSSIQAKATYVEVAVATFVINARYFLMSCSLSQKMNPEMPFFHRFFIGYGITDEIFGISVSQEGYLNPYYTYGAMAFAFPMWCIATALGVIAGTYLPVRIVSALSVALYGMFIAIIIPPCKKNFVIGAAVLSGFVLSYLCSVLPFVKTISGGTRTIILTVLISSVCAFVKPVEEV